MRRSKKSLEADLSFPDHNAWPRKLEVVSSVGVRLAVDDCARLGIPLDGEIHDTFGILGDYVVSEYVLERARLIARYVELLEHLSAFRR